MATSMQLSQDAVNKLTAIRDGELSRIRAFEDAVKKSVQPMMPCSDSQLTTAVDACVAAGDTGSAPASSAASSNAVSATGSNCAG